MSSPIQLLFEQEKERLKTESMLHLRRTSEQNPHYGFNADLDLEGLCPQDAKKWVECMDAFRVRLYHNGAREPFSMSLAEAISFTNWIGSLIKETKE